MPRTAFTAGKATDGSGAPMDLKTLFAIQEGHLCKYVQVRNDPLKNSVNNAYVLYAGVDRDTSYPLLFGEAKVFDACDPARFSLRDAGHAVNFNIEVAACVDRCPGCRWG